MGRRIVIGDVHGHYSGLMRLFEQFNPTKEDSIYFLGDLIDRGDESADVVSFVMENKYHCVMGNHEVMALESTNTNDFKDNYFWLSNGGAKTLKSYKGNEDLLYLHLNWMNTKLPYYYDLGDYFLVHAGLNPLKRLKKQTEDDFCWIREEFLEHKERYFPDKTIVVGHTITSTMQDTKEGEIVQGAGWFAIDTGYYKKGGYLTALDLDNLIAHQVSKTKKSRSVALERVLVPFTGY